MDHPYQPTMGGRCGRRGCGEPLAAHAPTVRQVEPIPPANPASCPADHASITTKQLIGDGGIELTRCPACNVQVEPHFSPIGAQGRPTDPGRGVLTDRQKKRLLGRAGWTDFNGGR